MYEDILRQMYYSINVLDVKTFLNLVYAVAQNPDFLNGMLFFVGLKLGFKFLLDACLCR